MFFTYLKKYLDRLLANKFTFIGLTFLLISSITKPAEPQNREIALHVAAHADRDIKHALLIHNSMEIARIQSGRVEKVKSLIHIQDQRSTAPVTPIDALKKSDFTHMHAIQKMLSLNSAFSPTSKSTVTLSQVNQYAIKDAQRRRTIMD